MGLEPPWSVSEIPRSAPRPSIHRRKHLLRTNCAIRMASSFFGQETPAFRHGEEWPSPFSFAPLRGRASRSQRSDTRALSGALVAQVKFPSTKLVSGLCVSSTGCNPVCLFNH